MVHGIKQSNPEIAPKHVIIFIWFSPHHGVHKGKKDQDREMVSLVHNSNCLANDSKLIFLMQARFMLTFYHVNSFPRRQVSRREVCCCHAAAGMGSHPTGIPIHRAPSLSLPAMTPPKCLGSHPAFSSQSGLHLVDFLFSTFCSASSHLQWKWSHLFPEL